MSIDTKEIGHVIGVLLKKRKFKITEFAKQLGIPRHQLANVLHGKSKKFDLLLRIAAALDVTIDDILLLSSESSVEHTSAIDFDSRNYTVIASQVSELLSELDIKISKKLFDKIVFFLDRNRNNFPKLESRLIIKWIILFAINTDK